MTYSLVNLDSTPYTGTSIINASGVTVPTSQSRLEKFFVKATTAGGASALFLLDFEICGLE